MSSLTNFNAIMLFGELEEGIAKEGAGLDRKIIRGRGCRTGIAGVVLHAQKVGRGWRPSRTQGGDDGTTYATPS